MTQIKVFSKKAVSDLEKAVNEFLATLIDEKVTIQYATNAYYYECCVVYEKVMNDNS